MHYACFTIKLCVYFTVRGTYICVVLPVIVEKMSSIAEPCLFVGSVKTTPNDTILTLVKTINHHDRFKKYTFCGRIYAYLMSKMLLNHRMANAWSPSDVLILSNRLVPEYKIDDYSCTYTDDNLVAEDALLALQSMRSVAIRTVAAITVEARAAKSVTFNLVF